MQSNTFALRIYLVALLLRVVPVLLARDLGIGLDDMFQYDMLARSLVAGNGYRWYAQQDINLLASYVDFDLSTVKEYDPVRGIPTSFRAPLYPAFLAVVYFFSGVGAGRFFSARLAQAVLLGAPLAPLTYFFSKRINPPSTHAEKKSEQCARTAAWVVACYPMLLVYPLGLGTENLFFVLVLGACLALMNCFGHPTPLNLFLSGLLLGLTAMTRSVILPFAICMLGWVVYRYRIRALFSLCGFLLLIIPWVSRNSLLHGRITGIESSMGYNLYLGYHPQGNGSFVFGPSLELIPILDDSLRDRIGTQRALEFIQAAPERVVPLMLNRLGFFFGLEKRVLLYFYSNDILGFIPAPLLVTLLAVLLLPFAVISTSAALGMSTFRGSAESTMLLLLLFTTYILPHALILSEDRFHLALIPFLAILASTWWLNGIAALALRWHESFRTKALVSISILLAAWLVLNWGIELSRDAGKLTALLGAIGNRTYFPY